MAAEEPVSVPFRQRPPLEAAIHVGLVALLVASCYFILRPFVPLMAWAVIIAIAGHPACRQLQILLRGRGRLAASLLTGLLLILLILPVVLFARTFVDGVGSLVTQFKAGTLAIPPPPPGVEGWPVIGPPLRNVWALASTNSATAIARLAPYLKAVAPGLLSASAGISLGVLQFALSILLAGLLLANVDAGGRVARSLANRLFGARGEEFGTLTVATVRSVASGILGVALIQSALAALGFLAVGLPSAGVWALVFLVAAVLQAGVVVLAPAVIYVFTIASTTKAAIFLVWCAIVGVADNALKPLLLGRGVTVPTAVVFLGALGGFLAMGIVGLFLGAVVLSVGYKLLLAWLDDGTAGG